MQSIFITLILTFEVFVTLILHNIVAQTPNKTQLTTINHVVNPETLNDEFNKLINYIEYKIFE